MIHCQKRLLLFQTKLPSLLWVWTLNSLWQLQLISWLPWLWDVMLTVIHDLPSNCWTTHWLCFKWQTLNRLSTCGTRAGCLDTGNYTCEADNGIQSAVSKSVQLVVRCELCRFTSEVHQLDVWNYQCMQIILLNTLTRVCRFVFYFAL